MLEDKEALDPIKQLCSTLLECGIV